MKLRGPCCAPTDPPSASAYKRHRRANTLPCPQSLADACAYRLARRRLTTGGSA